MTAEGKLKRENLGYETHTEGDGNRRRKQTNRDRKLELGRIAWISRSNKRDRIQLRFNLPRSRFIFVQMRTINATPTSIHDTNRPINKQQGAVYSFFTLLFFGFPHSLFSSVRTIVRNKHPTLVPGWNALDNWTRLNLIRAHSFFFLFSILHHRDNACPATFYIVPATVSLPSPLSFFFSLFLLVTPHCLTKRKLWRENLRVKQAKRIIMDNRSEIGLPLMDFVENFEQQSKSITSKNKPNASEYIVVIKNHAHIWPSIILLIHTMFEQLLEV